MAGQRFFGILAPRLHKETRSVPEWNDGTPMIDRLQITVLSDDHVAKADLLAEHGLSILIEADGQRILFDTGQGKVLRYNADALGIRLSGLDAVVLSHGHYDHTGGLAVLLPESSPSAIFLHPAALQPKYAKADGAPHRSIGIPECSRQALSAVHRQIVWTQSAIEVVPDIWCTGEIPRFARNEQTETGFFLDADGSDPDPLDDDQALFIETRAGIVVIMGCAHAGIVNTLDRVSALTGRDQICMLAGGLHLGRATNQQLEASADAIDRRNVHVLAPCHCTGMSAHSYLRARFHSLVQDVGVGTRLVLDER
jgi:7,8-dihydropterin-6-yl-methyl-4-(beta-D-ribofuranosyl)aminobenzene 5'-phosphate synthase